MARCYLCDSPIQGQGYRRNVKTSTTVSSRGNIRTTGGLRTLCNRCAYQQDSAFPHGIHILATVFTGGLWGIGYWLMFKGRSLPDPVDYGLSFEDIQQ